MLILRHVMIILYVPVDDIILMIFIMTYFFHVSKKRRIQDRNILCQSRKPFLISLFIKRRLTTFMFLRVNFAPCDIHTKLLHLKIIIGKVGTPG